jgi:hypothetical protein
LVKALVLYTIDCGFKSHYPYKGGQYELASSINYIWTSNFFTDRILEGHKVKKIWAVIVIIATAILSGALLSKFLNWAGRQDIFDFDLNEDIDVEDL